MRHMVVEVGVGATWRDAHLFPCEGAKKMQKEGSGRLIPSLWATNKFKLFTTTPLKCSIAPQARRYELWGLIRSLIELN